MVIIFATVYQQIENYYFSPRISSRTMDIHPAVAFGSVIAGAAFVRADRGVDRIPGGSGILAFLAAYTNRYELIPALNEAAEVIGSVRGAGARGQRDIGNGARLGSALNIGIQALDIGTPVDIDGPRNANLPVP